MSFLSNLFKNNKPPNRRIAPKIMIKYVQNLVKSFLKKKETRICAQRAIGGRQWCNSLHGKI